MSDPCPDPSSLAALSHGSLPPGDCDRVARHLTACAECRSVLGALEQALPFQVPARRPAWRWAAAAAAILAVVSVWRMSGRNDPGRTPLPEVQTPSGECLAVSASCRAPGNAWLLAGSRLTAVRGAVTRKGDAAGGPSLAMEDGELLLEHHLPCPLELSTPSGTLRGTGPLVATVRCGKPAVASWDCLLASADAAAPGELVVDLFEGSATLRLPEGPEDVRIDAGRRMVLGPDGPVFSDAPPAPDPGLRVWQGRDLETLLGGRSKVEAPSGLSVLPLPIPDGGAYVVEVVARTATPLSRVGLAVPSQGGARLWQADGTDCRAGASHRLTLAVLGRRASGSVDGRSLWSVGDLERDLQETEAPAGLRVWGTVEFLEVRIRTFPGTAR